MLVAVKEGRCGSAWVLGKHTLLKVDRTGRKHKTALTAYIVFVCNDPDCDARLGVLEEEVVSKFYLKI